MKSLINHSLFSGLVVVCAVGSHSARAGVVGFGYQEGAVLNGANSSLNGIVAIHSMDASGGNGIWGTGVYVRNAAGQTGISFTAHQGFGRTNFDIFVGCDAINNPMATYSFTNNVAIDPRYDPGAPDGRRWDSAVLWGVHLEGVDPFPILDYMPALGTPLVISGYGGLTTIGGPFGGYTGTRLMGTNAVQNYGSWFGAGSPVANAMIVSRMDSSGGLSEIIASPGDSGGGAFVNIGGQLWLAANLSNNVPSGYFYGDYAGGMATGEAGTYSFLNSSLAIPAPGSIALLGLAGLITSRRRR